MFLSSYEMLRNHILQTNTLCNLIHLGSRAFEEIKGEKVKTASCVLNVNRFRNFKSTFVRLAKFSTPKEKECEFFNNENYYNNINQNEFYIFDLPYTASLQEKAVLCKYN